MDSYKEGENIYHEHPGNLSFEDFCFYDRIMQERQAVKLISPCSQTKKQRAKEYVRKNYNIEVAKKIWEMYRL